MLGVDGHLSGGQTAPDWFVTPIPQPLVTVKVTVTVTAHGFRASFCSMGVTTATKQLKQVTKRLRIG
ncbi:MAG: hypothetical protein U1E22_01380, partial [Coriobacteriia bacterium]|nr:hypothetical protein [Coriobacteriia bacterium]